MSDHRGAPGGALARLGLTRGSAAATLTIATAGIAVGLMMPLLSLTLSERGVSERTIGLLVAANAVAMLIASPLTARIAGWLGAANTIMGVTVIAALLMPAVWLIGDPVWLFPVILVYGGCVALCFTLSEFWIAALTPAHRRGFVMGLYATLLSIGFAIGPLIIAVFRDGSIRPFLIGSVVLVAAALPALIARRESPRFDGHPRMRFSSYLFAAPTATLGAFVFAMGESGGFAFLPLWGQHLGFSSTLAVFLVSAMTLGNVVFQIPLGIFADRIRDRRLVLLLCGVIGAVGMPLAWLLADSPAALTLVLFIWGGVTAGIYTVGLAHLASRFAGSELASANAAFVFCYGFGMLVGPATLGDAVARAPSFGFPLVLGVAFALYALIVAYRIAKVKT